MGAVGWYGNEAVTRPPPTRRLRRARVRATWSARSCRLPRRSDRCRSRAAHVGPAGSLHHARQVQHTAMGSTDAWLVQRCESAVSGRLRLVVLGFASQRVVGRSLVRTRFFVAQIARGTHVRPGFRSPRRRPSRTCAASPGRGLPPASQLLRERWTGAFLSRVIEATDSDFLAATCAEWLEGRGRRPPDDEGPAGMSSAELVFRTANYQAVRIAAGCANSRRRPRRRNPRSPCSQPRHGHHRCRRHRIPQAARVAWQPGVRSWQRAA